MNSYRNLIFESLANTAADLLSIVLVLAFFQAVILRRRLPHLGRLLTGLVLVAVGLGIFLVGLEKCIFPLGKAMAHQLSDPDFLFGEAGLQAGSGPASYAWAIVFAFLIGFTTTLAEPSLLAVALKAKEISTGAISPWGLRLAVAFGVAFGVALGAYRIIAGTPLHYFIIGGYLILMVQTYFSPNYIIPLAFDSGGVTTSTVTVPLVVALGIGLAANVSGRSPLVDGFGLIAFASLFPIMSVLGYAMIGSFLAKRKTGQG